MLELATTTIPDRRPGTTVLPMVALLDWLGAHGLAYDLHEHPPAFTALEAAHVEGLDPHAFVKTLAVVRSDGRRALVALEAGDRLDPAAASSLMDGERIRLLTEGELLDLAGRCDIGALPPIGDLFGVPVYADVALRSAERVTFHAGSHRHAVRMLRLDWERCARIRYGHLATSSDLIAGRVTEWSWY
ncbi:MAG: aminoacyl-tRNA deacylase [Candidatus Limnocylindrales bacterium]|jgi:Ala-tRNA(Pro) deacylase